jgi:maleate cis-trans isomerase
MTDWRARLGFLIPPGTPTVEREMFCAAPEGVSVHFNRMVAKGAVGTLENLQQRAASQLANLDQTVDLLASVEPDVIVLAHTATSYTLGRDGDAELLRRMEARTGIPFVSALGSAAAALELLGVRRIAIGTPYDKALTLRSKEVLEQYGFEVVNAQCLPDVKCIFDEPPRRVYGLIKAVNRAEADAVFVSGVGLPTLSVLGQAEIDLGKPVLSSACAMLWSALGTAGIATPVPGCGRLLDDPLLRPPSAYRPVRHARTWVPS